MKRLISILLAALLVLVSCGNPSNNNSVGTTKESTDIKPLKLKSLDSIDWENSIPDFEGLYDEDLLGFLEDEIYSQLITEINTEEYYVDSVRAVYLSKEYLEEREYNSRENIFFGYSLSEVNSFFGETKFVFTTGDDGQTIVKKLDAVTEEEYFDRIVKNVLVGSGVILVCVTLASVSSAVSAPAAAAIFAASAKSATTLAMSGLLMGSISSGLIKAYETHDFSEAIKAAAVAGSEGFKWGAITGAITGAGKEALFLGEGTTGGLSLNEVARIQQESGYPMSVIKQFHSLEEYRVFKDASLKPYPILGRTVLIRTDIDPNLIGSDGKTNIQKMMEGYAPFSADGDSYDLHHIGQKNDGVLAILQKKGEHQKFFKILHDHMDDSEINRSSFDDYRKEFWKQFAKLYE